MLQKAAPRWRSGEKDKEKLSDWSINAYRDTKKHRRKYIHATSLYYLEYNFEQKYYQNTSIIFGPVSDRNKSAYANVSKMKICLSPS